MKCCSLAPAFQELPRSQPDETSAAFVGSNLLSDTFRRAVYSDLSAFFFGSAGGTIAANRKLPPENKWRTPAAWRAVVEGRLVKEWQVYADNKPVYDMIAKSRPNQEG